MKKFLSLAAIIFILNLAIIDFWAIWVGLVLAMVFLISFLSAGLPAQAGLSNSDRSVSETIPDFEVEEYHGLQLAYFQKAWLPSAILLVSLLFLFIPSPFARFIQAPVEVSPSFGATWNIGIENLKTGRYLLGSGPNTFGYIFNLYKPNGINQTIFWSTVFNGGASAMSSWLGAVGILGVLALLFLIVAFIWNGVGGAAVRNSSRGMMSAASQATFIGVCFLFVMWFLYAVNFTLMAFAFWGIGLFSAASFFFTKEEPSFAPQGGASKGGFLFKEIRIFTSPPKTFLFSLLFVGLMALSVMGLYLESNRYAAEFYASKDDYGSAVKFWQYDERYFQGLSRFIFMKLNDLLAQKDLPQETLRTEFQNITTNAISAARQAQALNPRNSFNNVLLGNIYENLIPFIADSANFALSAYSAAVSLDPQNPSNYLALARVEIARADLAAAGQKGEEEIGGYLNRAAADLEKAVNLKNDYAPARFLLVQVNDRQGKLTDAIKRAEELVSLNINDVGALFQLGFLYYKNSQFGQAAPVFERTIALSPNYSNARYFLGLIYDGSTSLTTSEKKEKALEQFNKIAELNPDNAEVKQIIANLTAKKPALSGIAPPAPAPQNRTETPISEGTAAPIQKLQK